MPRSVFANFRNFSHKGSADMSMCMAPDVCKTPAGPTVVPIPYPVMSQVSDLLQGTTSVKIDGNPTAIAGSSHAKCSGDQAGSAMGIISSTIMNKTQFTTYSFDVKAEGDGVVRHLDMTTMNNRNTMGINLGQMGMTQGADEAEATEVEMFSLRFVLVDELGQPLKNIPFQAFPAGQTPSSSDPDGTTNGFGKTPVVSTKQGEKIEFRIAWHTHADGN